MMTVDVDMVVARSIYHGSYHLCQKWRDTEFKLNRT